MPYTLAMPELTERFIRYSGETFPSGQISEESDRLENYERWLSAAIARAEHWCCQSLLQESKTFYFASTDDGSLWLPVMNVPVALTAVTTRPDWFTAPTNASGSNYALVSDGGLRVVQTQNLPDAIISITATVGYTDATLPEDLAQILVEMASEMRSESNVGSNRLGMTSVAGSMAGGSSTTSYRELDERHRGRLAPYRRAFA